MARRFYADILGTVKFDNKTATPVVQNETMKNAKLKAIQTTATTLEKQAKDLQN